MANSTLGRPVIPHFLGRLAYWTSRGTVISFHWPGGYSPMPWFGRSVCVIVIAICATEPILGKLKSQTALDPMSWTLRQNIRLSLVTACPAYVNENRKTHTMSVESVQSIYQNSSRRLNVEAIMHCCLVYTHRLTIARTLQLRANPSVAIAARWQVRNTMH